MSKNCFIITSSVKPLMGLISHEQRYKQTIDCLTQLRIKLPNEILVLADCSVIPLSDKEKMELESKVDLFIDLSMCERTFNYSKQGLKSHAENSLLYTAITKLKEEIFFKDCKRIFKFSSRSWLTEHFNLSDYDNTYGKYVFKKRIPTWMSSANITDLLITRMYSFCSSLTNDYLEVIDNNMKVLNSLDTEHAHFLNTPKDKLIEFNNIHCWGVLAGNGNIEHY